ncbi:MAG: ThuA domain-containing protein [Novosphingobium sp.]
MTKIARQVAVFLAGLVVIGAISLASPGLGSDKERRNTVLIVTHTTGYRHASIEAAADAIASMVREAGLEAEVTADPARFDRPLDTVRVIALVSTTTRRKDPSTEWLTGKRRDALQAFVRQGGGILAIHGAADSHYGWPWYGAMIGARFARHPAGTPEGQLTRANGKHLALKGMPRRFRHVDEWYWFADMASDVRPLVTLSARSIGEEGSDLHPVSWAREFEGGRVFYTSLGHTEAAWSDPVVLAHVRGGLLWAAHYSARQ